MKTEQKEKTVKDDMNTIPDEPSGDYVVRTRGGTFWSRWSVNDPNSDYGRGWEHVWQTQGPLTVYVPQHEIVKPKQTNASASAGEPTWAQRMNMQAERDEYGGNPYRTGGES